MKRMTSVKVLAIMVLLGNGWVLSPNSVATATAAENVRAPNGHKILVKGFSTDNVQVKGDKSTDATRVEAKKERVPRKLVTEIVRKLVEEGYDAAPYSVDVEGSGIFILDGEISLISNGSGAARVWIGFGAGSAKMKARVRVCSADNPSTMLADKTIKAKKGGGMFGGGNREDFVNRNFARKVVSLLEDTDISHEKSDK